MRFRPRVLVIAGFGLGPALLAAGCGNEATGSQSTLVFQQPSSYVVKDPATTTTTTTLAPGPPVEGVSPTEQIYTVVANDSISKIASIHDITSDQLVSYNGWTDGLTHFLGVGDQIKIPPDSKIPGTATATDTGTGETTGTSDSVAPGVACQHEVVANDNPTRVAKKYGITVDELAAANAGNPAYQSFLIGSLLDIPAGGDC